MIRCNLRFWRKIKSRVFDVWQNGVRVAIIDEDLEIRGINLAALAFKVNGLIRLLSVSLMPSLWFMLTHRHGVGYRKYTCMSVCDRVNEACIKQCSV